MGLLDQLWDETVAGPRPDSDLGKLRKHRPSAASSSAPALAADPVSRSITILRPPPLQRTLSLDIESSSSLPSSPSSVPDSPFTPRTPRPDWRRLLRKPNPDATEIAAEPRSPTAYDWVVISALDR